MESMKGSRGATIEAISVCVNDAGQRIADNGAVPDAASLTADAMSIEALLIARSYLYTLFNHVFGGDPTPGLVRAVTSDALLDVLDGYAEASPQVHCARAFLEELRARGAADPVPFADTVKGEFTRLFVGPGRPECFPYESPYRTNEATYFQANTVEVRYAYRDRGLAPRRCEHVPDDHVALECGFMALTACRLLDALRAGDVALVAFEARDSQAFMRDHLASWTSDFARMARRSATAHLYPQMAELLAEFAKLDAVFLGEAAFWAEGLLAQGASIVAALEDERPAAFAEIERARDDVAALRQNGIEDNELVALG